MQHSGALPSTANCHARTHRRCSGAPHKSSNGAAAQAVPSARIPRPRASPSLRRRSARAQSARPIRAAPRVENALSLRRSPESRLRGRDNTQNRSGNRALLWSQARWKALYHPRPWRTISCRSRSWLAAFVADTIPVLARELTLLRSSVSARTDSPEAEPTKRAALRIRKGSWNSDTVFAFEPLVARRKWLALLRAASFFGS